MVPLVSSAAFSFVHQSSSQCPSKPSQPAHIKIPTYPQPANLKAHPSSSSSSSSSIPLSQLLLHGTRTLAAGTTVSLVMTSAGAAASVKPAGSAQTLVVQPLHQMSFGAEKSGHHHHGGGGPVPIQPKTLQGLCLPLQLPSRNPPPMQPAPPPAGGSSAQPPPPPHIPVQIVGARQSTLGHTKQALALARGSCCQDPGAVASVASREGGGLAGRGAGLKAQEAPPPPSAQVSQVRPQAKQSHNGPLPSSHASSQAAATAAAVSSPPAAVPRSSLSLPLVTEERRGGGATTNGDSSRSQTPQVS